MEAAPARGLPLPSRRRELGVWGAFFRRDGRWESRQDEAMEAGGQEGSEGLEVLVVVDRGYRSWLLD
jgi:hypothetical protein